MSAKRRTSTTHHSKPGVARASSSSSVTHVSPASRAMTTTAEEKANPAFAGVTMFDSLAQPHTMPRNYKAYADEGYAANDSVFKCVNYIVTNGAAIPPKLFTDASMQTEIKSHPLLDRMARPNAEQDGVTFREGVLGWYLITGNAFIYAIRAGKTTGTPDELWSLNPNTVHPIPTPEGITGYKFDDFGNDDARNPIPPANIGHLRTWNPKDPIFGLSPIEVAALMVDQQNAARKWNLALLQNMAKPSGAWVTDLPLDKASRDRLEERINEKLAGSRNAGKVPVLDAGAKWTATSLPPSELDWLKSLQYNAGQIANIFNMPPQLIGDTSASTYNNMEQAKEASYTEAIFPALDKLFSLLTMWLVPMYPDLSDGKDQPKAFLYYDKESVEVVQQAIQERKNAQADRAIKAYMAGAITLNQAQEMQGLPDLGAKGNVYRMGAVLVPADKLIDYAEQSLAEPAAPPVPVAESTPLVAPGDTPATPQTPQAPQKPASTPPSPDDEPEPPQPAKKPTASGKKRLRMKGDGDGATVTVTHLLWECDADACDFCQQNDGAIVEADENGDAVEPFPNGCTTTGDSHRFCKCQIQQLALTAAQLAAIEKLASANSDNASTDGEQANAVLQLGKRGIASATARYSIGIIPSRHDQDVEAEQQQQQDDDDIDDDDDEQDDDDEGDDETPPPVKPKPKPKKPRAKRRRAEFRAFREETLGI